MAKFLQFQLIVSLLVSLSFGVACAIQPLKQNISNLTGLYSLYEDESSTFILSANDKGNASVSDYVLGMIALQSANFDVAVEKLTNVRTLRPLAHHQLVVAYDRQGSWKNVLEHADLENSFERNIYIKNLINHNSELSTTQIQEYHQKVKPYGDTLLSWAQALLSEKRFDEAIKVAQEVNSPAEYVGAQVIIGRALYYQNKLDDALKILRQQYENDPQLLTQYWYGKTLFRVDRQEEGLFLMKSAILNARAFNVDFSVDLAYSYAIVGRCSDADRITAWALSRVSGKLANDKVMNISIRISKLCSNSK